MMRNLLITCYFAICGFTIASAQNLFPEAPTNFPQISSSNAKFVDFDNDGDLDLFFAGIGDSLGDLGMLFENNAGVYQNSGFVFAGLPYGDNEWIDFDHDGDLDLFVLGGGSPGEFKFAYYRNDLGSFVETSIGLSSISLGSIAKGDIDNDGDCDLIATGVDTNYSYVSAIFSANGISVSQIGDTNIAKIYYSAGDLQDFDNDGDLDLMSAGEGSSGFVTNLYINNSGIFTNSSQIFPGYAYCGLGTGDMDSDGDIDVAFSGRQSNSNQGEIHNNLGGIFTFAPPSLDSLFGGSSSWGDVDGDGDLDLLVNGINNAGSESTNLYLNNSGTFSNVGAPFQGTTDGGSVFGDFDNDGDLDIFVHGAGNGTGNAKLYRNDFVTSPNTPPTKPDINALYTINPDSSITISWSGATDNETPTPGLSYSLWIGTSEHGIDITSPPADTASGYRRVVEYGQVKTTSWTLKGLDCANEYWFRVQAVDGGYMGSEFSTPLHVVLQPEVAVTQIGGQSVSATVTGTSAPDSIQWYDATGAAIIGANALVLDSIVPVDTTVFLSVTVWKDFCSASTQLTGYPLVSSVDEIKTSTVKIWPNPTNSAINVRVDNPGATEAIEIFDMQGKLMRSMKAGFTTTTAIELNGLASGLYVVKMSLKNGRGIATATFVKE